MAERRFSRRTGGRALRDNLSIIAGLGADHVQRFRRTLQEWLEDRHPSVARAGYALHVIESTPSGKVVRVYTKGEQVPPFDVERKVSAPYGVYAAFQDKGFKFYDLNTGCANFTVGREEDLAYVPPDDTPGVELLNELVPHADRARYAEWYQASVDRGEFQLLYHRPSTAELHTLSCYGGTGLLEPYPPDPGIRERVHSRNLAFLKNCTYAYELYIKLFVQRVQAIDADAKAARAAGLPEPEIQLRKLGPPESPWEFPTPPGVRQHELEELSSANQATALPAWRAIAAKLDEIWGQRSSGSAWLTCGFELEPSLAMQSAVGDYGITGKIAYNFEADEKGEVKMTGAQRSITVHLGIKTLELDQDGNLSDSYEFNSNIGVPQEKKKEAAAPGENKEAKPKKKPKYLVTAQVDEAGSTPVISQAVKYDPESGEGSVKFKVKGVDVSLSLDKEKLIAGVKAKVGGYGFEFNQDGKVGVEVPTLAFSQESGTTSISAGILSAEADRDAKTFGVGMELDLKDWFAKRFGENGQDPPDWVERLPGLKVSLGAHFQSARDSDILRVLGKTPGLWQLRPRSEFVTIGWDSLDADEQAALRELGFTKRSWDRKQLPSTTKGKYAELTAEQMMATLHLPVPSCDPYWQPYWQELAANGPNLGTVIVHVQDGTGARKSGVQVRLSGEEGGPTRVRTTGQHGEATFEDLMVGRYRVAAGSETSTESTSSRSVVVTVKQASETESILTLV